MQRIMPTTHFSGSTHYPQCGEGYAPYSYPPPYGYYPYARAHPYPYGGYEPLYHATSSPARRCMSISPGRSHSSRRNMEAQGEHDTQHAKAAMNAHAEEDDIPLLQVFCQATSNELPAEHVNCGPSLLVFVPFIVPCVPVCCILIFLQARTNFLMHVQALACGTSMQAPSPAMYAFVVCFIELHKVMTQYLFKQRHRLKVIPLIWVCLQYKLLWINGRMHGILNSIGLSLIV